MMNKVHAPSHHTIWKITNEGGDVRGRGWVRKVVVLGLCLNCTIDQQLSGSVYITLISQSRIVKLHFLLQHSVLGLYCNNVLTAKNYLLHIRNHVYYRYIS